MQTYYVSDVKFTASDKNPAMANYTLGAYERAGGFMVNDERIQYYKGLLASLDIQGLTKRRDELVELIEKEIENAIKEYLKRKYNK